MKKHLLYALLSACLAAPASASEREVKSVASVAFVEGPALHPDGSIYFTDIPNDRIMRWSESGPAQVHRSPAGHANGMIFDKEGRLVIAENDGRLVREDADGNVEVLADEFRGAPFNALNDVAIDSKGRIYFTDPAYRNRNDAPQRDAGGKVIDGVYRYDPTGKVTRILAHEISMPNGILVSPNDEYLYVAENSNLKNGARKLWRFNLRSNGSINTRSGKVIYDWGTDRGPDGMAIDVDGNIYAAAGLNRPSKTQSNHIHKGGVYVISPAGVLLDFIPVPMDKVSNVTFGGKDRKTLFVTAGHSLWRFDGNIAGYRPF